MRVTLTRQNDAVHFLATNQSGQSINLDGSPSDGGQDLGVRPMENLLMSLGGCSGIDIQMILKKQRQVADTLEIDISAQRQQNVTPALFDGITVLFKATGDLDKAKLLRAVDLSMEKYCSVAKVLEASTTITYSTELNGELISTP